jgi:AcrR family transcriptional regulator
MTPTKTRKTSAGRPPGSTREGTLARLLPAARLLFAEKGYAQTTFKDVGSAAGLSHAAVYSYFGSKQALYLATLEDAQAMLLPDYLQAIATGQNLREQIAGILMASAAAHDRDSSITGFLASVPIEIRRHPELMDALSQQHNGVFSALQAMFDDARKHGEINTDANTDALISAFLGGGVGVALFQYGLLGTSLTTAMGVFVQMLEGTIFNKGNKTGNN